MRRTPRRVFIIATLVPLLLVGGAVGASAATKRATHVVYPGVINLSYATNVSANDFNVNLAVDTGIFKKYGLTVNPEVVGAAALPAALESGAIQLSFESAPQIELAYQSDVPVKLIATTAERSVEFLAVRPEITAVSQLAGKPVGSSSPTALSQIEVEYALHAAGVPVHGVTYIPVNTASAVGELVNGAIDAAALNFQQVQVAKQALPGIHVLVNYLTALAPWPCGNLWGYVPWLSTHKAEAVAFFDAENAAVVKWNSDPTGAGQEIARIAAVTSPQTVAKIYSTTEQELNKGSQPVRLPTTKVEAFINKVLREVGFPTAYNSYADEGQEWTPVYWDAAFGKKK